MDFELFIDFQNFYEPKFFKSIFQKIILVFSKFIQLAYFFLNCLVILQTIGFYFIFEINCITIINIMSPLKYMIA